MSWSSAIRSNFLRSAGALSAGARRVEGLLQKRALLGEGSQNLSDSWALGRSVFFDVTDTPDKLSRPTSSVIPSRLPKALCDHSVAGAFVRTALDETLVTSSALSIHYGHVGSGETEAHRSYPRLARSHQTSHLARKGQQAKQVAVHYLLPPDFNSPLETQVCSRTGVP